MAKVGALSGGVCCAGVVWEIRGASRLANECPLLLVIGAAKAADGGGRDAKAGEGPGWEDAGGGAKNGGGTEVHGAGKGIWGPANWVAATLGLAAGEEPGLGPEGPDTKGDAMI